MKNELRATMLMFYDKEVYKVGERALFFISRFFKLR